MLSTKPRHKCEPSDRDDLGLRRRRHGRVSVGPSAALMLAAKVEKAPTISEVER
jgi:hypothetical protein